MAKIRINKLPDGFEIKDGKVVKRMQRGGMMTGDQSNYGLVTSPYNFGNDQFNNTDDVNVRYSLSSVPREMANLEAEGGETVLTDLNNDGQFGLYNITGPRHSKGGVPMYLPEQSFVYSDTPKMKFNRQEMAEFGIESRKKKTPAEISKKFQLNEYIGAMADPFADNITKKSAEIMIDKNQMSLSKLAFGQESKKQFSDGVPVSAHPYLISQGINPIEFTQKVENITREQAAQRMFEGLSPEQQAQVMALRQMMEQAGQMQQPMQPPMAAYGMELPKFQNTGAVNFFNTRQPSVSGMFPNISLNGAMMKDSDGDGVADMFDPDPSNPLISFRVVPSASSSSSGSGSGTGSGSGAGSGGRSGSGSGGGSSSSGTWTSTPGSLGEGYKQYQELERLFRSGEPMWNQTLERAYRAFVILAKDKGMSESDIPTKEQMLDKFLAYQKNNYMIQDLASSEDRFNSILDKGAGEKKNKNTQSLFNHIKAMNPDIYEGYTIDDNDTKLNQLFFQAVYAADANNAEPYLAYKATGPSQTVNWDVDKTVSKVEGYYGNNTLNQTVQVKEPITPETPKEGCPCEDGSYSQECCPPPEIPPPPPIKPYVEPDLDFYTQDLYKGAAIALRDRNMYMPFRQAIERPRADYVLEEPTRQIADINEKYNIGAQAFGTFGGPQLLGARLSSLTGSAMPNTANVFARVHGRNINTINSGLARKSQLDAAFNTLDAKRNDEQYDATQATLQIYDNEKMADMTDFMNWQAKALTNAVGAYDLSSLYDQFNINPVMGGTIDFVNGRRPIPSKQGDPRVAQQQRLRELQDLYNMFGKDGVNKAMIDYYTTGSTAQVDPGMMSGNYAEQYGLTPEILNAIALANGQAKKGKEIKKFATPFYTGKMGL